MASSFFSTLRRLPLTQKILSPFFLILVLLGLIATIGAVHQTQSVLSDNIQQRLLDQQAIIEQAVRTEEQLLSTHIGFIKNAFRVTAAAEHQELLNVGITGADEPLKIYTQQDINKLDNGELQQLFLHAGKSGKHRIRFFSSFPSSPALVVATRLPDENNQPRYALLFRLLDERFLKTLMKPLRGSCYLFNQSGHFLATNADETPDKELTDAELVKLAQGEFISYETGNSLLHYFAVPLGTTDLLVMAVSLPTHGIEALVSSLAFRSAGTVLIVMLLFGYLFYKFIRKQLKPVSQLLQATKAVSTGDLDYRITHTGEDELGQLSSSFNSMVDQLSCLYQDKLDQERQITTHQEELKYKVLLEAKNSEIERANFELRTHLKEMSALLQLNQAMTSTLELGTLFERMLSVLKDLIHCDRMVLFTYNPGSEELVVRKTYGIDPELLKGMTFALDEGITGKAALSQEMLYIEDLKSDSRNLGYKGKSHTGGSMVAVPLVVKKRLAGILNLHKIEPGAFSESDLKMVQAIANQAAIAIDNSQLYERTRNLSNTDELTGLANRRHFQMILKREMTQAQRFHSHFSLIIADIDHFKEYNDTHGHLKGDIVLKKVADILLQNTRGIDLVARFGGEEFVILLPKTDKIGAQAAAEKLRACIMADTFPGEEESQPQGVLTISIGISEYPTDTKDIYELLDLADRALYRSKEEGRNRVSTWQLDMQSAIN